jgi:adenine-specific DNA-methyltransferase
VRGAAHCHAPANLDNAPKPKTDLRPPTSIMNPQFLKLKNLLKELFQLDQPDLDFGIYRIMHAGRAEIVQYIERDLQSQVEQELGRYRSADVDWTRVECEVYDHLYSFFRRYYSEGDFLSKRDYKLGVYTILSEGEEVKLHWANHDQYYIKTCEYLRDYAFRLRPDDEGNPGRVHFRLVDAAEGEHGDSKEQRGKDRVFLLATDDPLGEELGEAGTELVVRFQYRPATVADWPAAIGPGNTRPPAQKDLTVLAEARIAALAAANFPTWCAELIRPHVRADGELTDYSRLRAHLNRYVARNTFDYFIHQDLGKFLRRELDFYIKNEVMRLDDVEDTSAAQVEQLLFKINVLRRIAGKIIAFLAQLEEFQKRLWLKKKFVVETRYCIAVGQIPDTFYPEIAAADGQWAEWENLHSLSQWARERGAEALFGDGAPLKSVAFLKANPTLMIDTRHFDPAFTVRLLEAMGDLEQRTDGLLVHGENHGALALLQTRYRGRVDRVYIDPPYNTGDAGMLYKNTYRRSSWLTLMANRLDLAVQLLTPDPVLFIAIDDFAMADLAALIDQGYPLLRREMIIVNHHPQGGKATTLAQTHEYMLACVADGSSRTLTGRMTNGKVELRSFKRGGTAESNFRDKRPNSFYAILVDPRTRAVVGIEEPPRGEEYPTGPTAAGHVRVYPLGLHGEERVWRRSYESGLGLFSKGKLKCSAGMAIYQEIAAHERSAALFSNWVDPRYNAGTFGANLLRDIIGTHNPFAYPKSIHTVADALFAAGCSATALVLDFFAGSGTTGHAVVNLNRENAEAKGWRRFILVEMGNHFDTVLLPRLKKITLTPEWKDGKPQRRATPREAARSPRIMKVIRLESYEDTLNNLQVRRMRPQQGLLDAGEAQGPDRLQDEYRLRYMVDVEAHGDPSLLNIAQFTDPTRYLLNVKRAGSDESEERCVDLLETFNWLLGLTVNRIAAPQRVRARFARDVDEQLRLSGELVLADDGPYWFRTVTGSLPDGREALVIWRNRPGGDTALGIERDNLVLDAWFTRRGYAAANSTFDIVYVNGSTSLAALRRPEVVWTVRPIEVELQRSMFASAGGGRATRRASSPR